MIDLILKRIMANVAQYTTLFDTETVSTTCVTQNNTITIDGLVGEYVLSGGTDGVASKGCLNQLLNFENGVATTDCFFGSDASTVACVTHKVNVGKAIKRDFALEMMVDDKISNVAIVYWQSTENTQASYKYSISEDLHTQYEQKFGVLAKIKATEMEAIGGCNVLDKVLANSVIEIDNDDATLIRFDRVQDRFFAGKYYCVDLAFSYLEDMDINDIISERLKHFDFNTLNIEQ